MNHPSFDDPFGRKTHGDRPPVKAPADLNWDAIESKIKQRKQAVVTGEPKYDSSGYLGRMREEDPWPVKDEKSTDSLSLFNCRFLTPAEDLLPDEPCTVACDAKILQAPSSRDLHLRLQYRLADTDPWTDSNESASAALKADAPNQTVQADLTLYCPTPAPDLGTMLHFRVVAEHSEAAANAEGPDTPVRLRNPCHFVGGPEVSFRNDGECPIIDETGGLIQALAAVVKHLSQPKPMGPDTVIIFGFASSSGSDAHNRDLSKIRAQALKALLGHDPDAWIDLAKAHYKTIDIQQILSGLGKAFRWPCDPGAVDGAEGPKTRSAIQAFQGECNSRYSLGLKPDGVCGPKTWGAVHRAICAQVAEAIGQDPSVEPSWPEIPWGYPDGKGVYACGEDFASEGDAASDRHAEICVFGSNMEPELKAPAPGAKVTIAEDPVEDPEKFVKVKLQGIGSDKPPPSGTGTIVIRLVATENFEAGTTIEFKLASESFSKSISARIDDNQDSMLDLRFLGAPKQDRYTLTASSSNFDTYTIFEDEQLVSAPAEGNSDG